MNPNLRPDLRELVYQATGERPPLRRKPKRRKHPLVCSCWACELKREQGR